MKYIVTKEIKSEPRVMWKIYLQDFFFLFAYGGFAVATKGRVHESLRIVYAVFSITMALILVVPSSANPKRRNYQSIVLYFLSPKCVYKLRRQETENENHNLSTKKKRR